MNERKTVNEIEEIVEISKSMHLSSDDLITEAECVEEYGECMHTKLIGYSASDLLEAAKVIGGAA